MRFQLTKRYAFSKLPTNIRVEINKETISFIKNNKFHYWIDSRDPDSKLTNGELTTLISDFETEGFGVVDETGTTKYKNGRWT